MTELRKDWTHLHVKITDIRRLSKLYVIYTNVLEQNTTGAPKFIGPLFVNAKIFEERLAPYFLKDVHRITREDILGVEWNMYITKGYFIKIDKDGNVKEFPQMDKEKYYVSYLEIAGDLGTFTSIYHTNNKETDDFPFPYMKETY
jgi:hypothetical protein